MIDSEPEEIEGNDWSPETLTAPIHSVSARTIANGRSKICFTEDGSPAEPIPVDTDTEIPGFGDFSGDRGIDNRCECHFRELREEFHQLDFR
jgi:hypothetical protein